MIHLLIKPRCGKVIKVINAILYSILLGTLTGILFILLASTTLIYFMKNEKCFCFFAPQWQQSV